MAEILKLNFGQKYDASQGFNLIRLDSDDIDPIDEPIFKCVEHSFKRKDTNNCFISDSRILWISDGQLYNWVAHVFHAAGEHNRKSI